MTTDKYNIKSIVGLLLRIKKIDTADKKQLADVRKAEAARDACLEKCKVT